MQHRHREIQCAAELRPDSFLDVLRERLVERSLHVPVDVIAVRDHHVRPERHAASEQPPARRHVQVARLAIQGWTVVAAGTRVSQDTHAIRHRVRRRKRLQRPGIAERCAAGIRDPQLVLRRRLERRHIKSPEPSLRVRLHTLEGLAVDGEARRAGQRRLERRLDQESFVARDGNEVHELPGIPRAAAHRRIAAIRACRGRPRRAGCKELSPAEIMQVWGEGEPRDALLPVGTMGRLVGAMCYLEGTRFLLHVAQHANHERQQLF